MPLERWEKLERTAVMLTCALLVGATAWALVAARSTLFWLTVFLWPFALSSAWHVFFEDRLDSNESLTTIETRMATAWVWFRRISLTAIAFLFGVGGFSAGVRNDFVGLVLGFGLCAGSLWVAVFGGGRAKSMSDDREIHAKRKARYKWWF